MDSVFILLHHVETLVNIVKIQNASNVILGFIWETELAFLHAQMEHFPRLMNALIALLNVQIVTKLTYVLNAKQIIIYFMGNVCQNALNQPSLSMENVKWILAFHTAAAVLVFLVWVPTCSLMASV